MKRGVAIAAIALGVAAVFGVLAGLVLHSTGIGLPFFPAGSASGTAREPRAVPSSDLPSGFSVEPTGDTTLDPTSSPTPSTPPDFGPAFTQVNTGVLRVLASTCAGSGVSSGFLVSRRTVVTALAAVAEPAAITVQIGRVPVPATLRATDPKRGLAVLRLAEAVPGHVFSADGVQLAPGRWVGVVGRPLGSGVTVPSSHRVVGLGKKSEGASGLAMLDGAVDPGLSGAPLIDTKGRAIGMIVPGAGTELLAVPGAALKAAVAKPANTNPKKASCGRPAGPRVATPVAGDGPAAVRATLKRYFTAINTGDYNTAYDQLGPGSRGASRARAASGWRSTYDFNIQIRQAAGSEAWVTFDSIFAAGKGPPGTSTCARWSLVYTFVESGGKALINRVEGRDGRLYRAC
jgi:S1-C subfamily serine protease